MTNAAKITLDKFAEPKQHNELLDQFLIAAGNLEMLVLIITGMFGMIFGLTITKILPLLIMRLTLLSIAANCLLVPILHPEFYN